MNAGPFSGLAEAQREAREQLRALEAELPAIAEALTATCVLELSKLTSSRPPLAVWVREACEVMAQLLPVGWLGLSVELDDIPGASTTVGWGSDLVVRTEVAVEGAASAHLELGGVAAAIPLAVMLEPLVAHLAKDLSQIVAGERAERAGAADRAVAASEALSDWRDLDRLDQLVDALAMLPAALGARVRIVGPGPRNAVESCGGVLADPTIDDEQPLAVRAFQSVVDDLVAIDIELAGDVDEPRVDEVVSQVLDRLRDNIRRVAELDASRWEHEHDEPTGLPDRRGLRRAFGRLARWANRSDEQVGLVCVVVGGGEAAGANAAPVLTAELPGEVIGRVAPTSYVALLPGRDLDATRVAAQRLCIALGAAASGASAGIAVFPVHTGVPDRALRAVEEAAASAAAEGPSRVVVAAVAD